MWLVVGLGNPGPRYADNRHNIGFMAVDTLHSHYAFSPWKTKFRSAMAEGNVTGVEGKVILLKPETYMNLSGEAVQAAAQFYKVPLSGIIVFHDELDVAPGKVKIKTGGGAGGHNGIKSLDEHMGPDYMRVRLGIGHPDPQAPDKSEIVSRYVLSDFSKADATWLECMLKGLSRHFPLLLLKGASEYLNALNTELKTGFGSEGIRENHE